MLPSRALGSAVAVVFALAHTGCASMTVNSYAERGIDFAQYLTYSWAPVEERSTGDPRLDNNPFFSERLQAEVEQQLTRRGYLKAPKGQPDLLVHYHVNISQEVDLNGIDRRAGYTKGDSRQPFACEAGTLWIDVVDARWGQVIWRGWASGSVDGVVDNQAWMEQKIGEVVARIMEKFPSHS